MLRSAVGEYQVAELGGRQVQVVAIQFGDDARANIVILHPYVLGELHRELLRFGTLQTQPRGDAKAERLVRVQALLKGGQFEDGIMRLDGIFAIDETGHRRPPLGVAAVAHDASQVPASSARLPDGRASPGVQNGGDLPPYCASLVLSTGGSEDCRRQRQQRTLILACPLRKIIYIA